MHPELDQWRISDGWFDVRGNWNATSEDVRRALRATIDEHLRAEDHDPPAPVWFVHHGETHELLGRCAIQLEDSTVVPTADMDHGLRLPPDLPLGVHQLIPLDGGPVTRLFVVPQRQSLPRRGWGWAAQLYSARSGASWGHGDLSNLAHLTAWSASHGASLLAHSPLGDTMPLEHQEPSPYLTSSRRFRSLLYLRVEDVAGAATLGSPLDALAESGRALNAHRLIDRDLVYALKLQALRSIWDATNATDATRAVVKAAMNDPELVDHATFNALAHHFGTGWDKWDRMYSHPRSRSVQAYRTSNLAEVEFWAWIQATLDEQYRSAARCGAGLMGDLPVGFAADGSDAWVDQDALALDWRVGAPGDDFNPEGQNWGVVPYLPQKLRAFGYEPWLRTLRRVLRDVSALRIDHVMGLFRLFVIPNEDVPTDDVPTDDVPTDDVPTDAVPPDRVNGSDRARDDGAYLYHYGTEMLDLALLEAVRAGVILTGEDLGTVEEGVRAALDERNVMGYRVAWFEDVPPDGWSEASVGVITTHDLPTIAGLVGGADAELRRDAGLDVDEADDALMLGRLAGNLLDHEVAEDDPHTPGSIDETIVAAHASLAGAGSLIVLAALEDACAVVERPNIPGTVDENPNWRRALPMPIDGLDGSLATAIADAMTSRADKVEGRHHG